MMRIALTGSIGMGKSTVARMFAAHGVPIFDSDAVVRKLQAEEESLITAIGDHFPGTVVGRKLDRKALAAMVLASPRKLEMLESLIHPAVQAARTRFINGNRDADALLFEIPLLYEKGGGAEFDKVIVASAPPEVQRERVLARPDMTEQKFDAILARQLPDADKRRRADFVIDTGGDLSTTEDQVRQILSCLGLAQDR
jgi:dephospho-CoA kinase